MAIEQRRRPAQTATTSFDKYVQFAKCRAIKKSPTASINADDNVIGVTVRRKNTSRRIAESTQVRSNDANWTGAAPGRRRWSRVIATLSNFVPSNSLTHLARIRV